MLSIDLVDCNMPDNIEKVYNRCIECIKIDKYVRLGYVIQEEFKIEETKAFYYKIAFMLTKSGEYKTIDFKVDKSDWLITYDPNYQFVKRQRKLARIAILVAAASLLVSSLSVYMNSKNGNSTVLRQIDNTLQRQQQLISLPLLQIDTSLRNLQKKQNLKNADTLKIVQ